MGYDFFSRLMEEATPRDPRKEVLFRYFMHEVERLPNLTREDASLLTQAFDISFDGHRATPPRESGEAYFYHVLRSAIRMIWRQVTLRIHDPRAIALVLLHDCYEETQPGIDSILIRTTIAVKIDHPMASNVFILTKHRERNETSHQYCTRLSACDQYRVIWSKFEDRYDNIWSINAMPHEKCVAKIRETRHFFPIFARRLKALIVQNPDLRGQVGFQKLPDTLLDGLMYAITAQGH